MVTDVSVGDGSGSNYGAGSKRHKGVSEADLLQASDGAKAGCGGSTDNMRSDKRLLLLATQGTRCGVTAGTSMTL